MRKVKLSEFAKMHNITYQTAWKWFKENKIAYETEQTQSGSIFVSMPDPEEKSWSNLSVDSGNLTSATSSSGVCSYDGPVSTSFHANGSSEAIYGQTEGVVSNSQNISQTYGSNNYSTLRGYSPSAASPPPIADGTMPESMTEDIIKAISEDCGVPENTARSVLNSIAKIISSPGIASENAETIDIQGRFGKHRKGDEKQWTR